jgi:hypothetical protein
MDLLNERFAEYWSPFPNASLDEAMVGFKGRSWLVQYMRDKPCKWGFKVWILACALTGYVNHLEVYQGSRRKLQQDGSYKKVGEKHMVAKLVGRMAIRLPRGSHIFMDRYFTSPVIFAELWNKYGIACTGTCMSNRKGWPKHLNIKDPKKEEHGFSKGSVALLDKISSVVGSAKRGGRKAAAAVRIRSDKEEKAQVDDMKDDMDMDDMKDDMDMDDSANETVQTLIQGRLRAVTWVDKSCVALISTGSSLSPVFVKRKNRLGAKININCPQLVRDYNDYMGGVDQHDSLRCGTYNTEKTLIFHKWWLKLFFGLVNIAITNAYVIFRLFKHQKKKSTTQLHFRFLNMLQIELFKRGSSAFALNQSRKRRRKSGPSAKVAPVVVIDGEHVSAYSKTDPGRKDGKRRLSRLCRVCKKKRTNRGCSVCNIYVCLAPGCWRKHCKGEFNARGAAFEVGSDAPESQ